MSISKTFFVTVTYDEGEELSHEFTDENLNKNIETVTEASFLGPVDVNVRRAFPPEEIVESSSVVLH